MTEYEWDHRNRLTKVTERASATGDPISVVEYTYDVFDRRITKQIDANGGTTFTPTTTTHFVYDGDHISLEFSGSTLSHRYLHGPAIDQVLADENVLSGTLLWALTDNLGTVRDWVDNTAAVKNHLVYDAFGKVIGESRSRLGDMDGDGDVDNFDSSKFLLALSDSSEYEAQYPAITDYQQRGDMNRDGVFDNYDTDYFDRQLGSGGEPQWTGEANLFGFTGRERDQETGLQYNRARYYDARAGRWISEDPIGFAGGDANLSRYVTNSPTNSTDPSGLAPPARPPSGFFSSLGCSLRSMPRTYEALILSHYYGLPVEADRAMREAYRGSPNGQTEHSTGVYYYGTRGWLGVATVATVAAVGVGGVEVVFLGNQPLLAEGACFGGRMGSGGLGQIRPTGGPPWIRADYHPLRPGGPSIPHIDSPPLGWHHWPWQW